MFYGETACRTHGFCAISKRNTHVSIARRRGHLVGGPIGLQPISIAETRMLNVSHIIYILFQVVGKLLRGFLTIFRNKTL